MDVQQIFEKCTAGKKEGKITATTVSFYHKSPFIIWAEAFASEDKKDPESAYQRLLFQRGLEHEQKIVSELFPDSETFSYKDLPEGFNVTSSPH